MKAIFRFSILLLIPFLSSFEIVPNLMHTDRLNSMAVTQDGKRIVTASDDKTVKIWDVASLRAFRTLTGHEENILKVMIAPDNKTAVSIDKKSFRIWDIISGKLIHQSKIDDICDLDISPDGKQFCLVQSFKTTIFNIATGQSIYEYDGYNDDAKMFYKGVFSPDGNSVALIYSNIRQRKEGKKIIIWKVNPNYIVKTLQGKQKDINTIKYDQTGKYIISGGGPDDATISVWDVTASTEIKSFTGFSDAVQNLSFNKNQQWLAFSVKEKVKILDLESGKELFNFNDKSFLDISGVSFIHNDKDLLITNVDKSIKIVNIETQEISEAISGNSLQTNEILSFHNSLDNNLIVCGKKYNIEIWDLASAKMKKNLPGIEFDYGLDNDLILSPDKKTIFFAKNSLDGSLVHEWDIANDKANISLKGHKDFITSIALSPDGATLYSCGWEKSFRVWNVKTGKLIKEVNVSDRPVSNLVISSDGKLLATGGGKSAFVYNTEKLKNPKEMKSPTSDDATIQTMAFCGTEILAVSDMYQGIDLYNATNGEHLRKINKNEKYLNTGVETYAGTLASSKDGKLLIAGYQDNTIKIWETSTGNLEHTIASHSSYVVKVNLSADEKYLYTASADGLMKVFSFPDCEELATMTANKKEWLVITPDGYYDCSVHGGDLVSIIDGNEIFAIDQFAVSKNRPDIILARLGISNDELIQHYKNQYLKRLRKLGINENKLSAKINYPNAKIFDATKEGSNLKMNLEFTDSRFSLKRYNIYVNDIPLFGSLGKELEKKSIKLEETITLQSGLNKIEVSCINTEGVESPRASYVVKNDIKKQSNLYLLAFGVSKYQNTAYNLQYADKDANDLAKTIETLKGKGFETVYTKVLTNEQVTPESIKTSKDFVKDANPDDVFILYIAGHGMHDKDADATYYYLTSNADINDLKNTTIDFETIEDLLQGIPPRNKLFLMDACESGEIDEEDQGQMIAAATGTGIASRGFKKTDVSSSTSSTTTKRSYLYQKDRYIYNDLVRRSGAIVFSSSKGGELSYERSDIENGLFTENIMKALTTSEADKDANGTISTDELREYVSTQVAKASGDLQHPTVDRDNIYQKFGFGVK